MRSCMSVAQRVGKTLMWLALLAAGEVSGQERTVSYEGQIVWEGGRPEELAVELVQSTMIQDKTMVNRDGQFQFRSVREGQYELRIVTRMGDVVRRDFVTVREPLGPIFIELPPRTTTRSGGTISAKALARVIPKAAREHFVRADKAAKKQRFPEAIAHLREAVAIFPEYLEAWNNLGVRYMHLRQFDDAVNAFGTALRIEPGAALARANLAIVLVTMQRYAEAETEAREALQLDPSLLQASYALGLSWAGRGDCRSDAIRHLQEASEKFPRAHLAAAHLLACQGNAGAASEEVRAWLRVATPDQRPVGEAFLQRLAGPR